MFNIGGMRLAVPEFEHTFQNYERYANPERIDHALADLLRKA